MTSIDCKYHYTRDSRRDETVHRYTYTSTAARVGGPHTGKKAPSRSFLSGGGNIEACLSGHATVGGGAAVIVGD
jgi:hypothetical protein